MSFAPDSRLATTVVPAANFEPRRGGRRPDLLLLHYTGMTSCARAIDWLTRAPSRVSCHYAIDVDGEITQMVREADRAWHAGAGSWTGEADINSCSIGIEIHNPGHDLGLPAYPEAQMRAVEALSRDIIVRWSIRPERVLGHSDIAPARKADPGEHFDWGRLAAAGVGHWVQPAPVDAGDPGLGSGSAAPEVAAAQRLLAAHGYGIEVTGVLDAATGLVLAAFQRHFRPARVDGRLDASTVGTLERLVAALPCA